MENTANKKLFLIGGVIILVIALCFVFRCHYDRGGWNDNNQNTITVNGYGEVSAVPDIANVSFTIKKEAKTVKEAQAEVTEVEKKVLESLKTNNVLEKDIKTVNTSFNPNYDYKYGVCNQYSCPPKNIIVGFEVYESINIKIRNTDDTGKIIEELGSLGVTELSGPNFAVEKKDELKTEARKKAIDEARLKAKVLAKDLGVHLGKIASFYEGGNYPITMYENSKMDWSVSSASATSPVLPVGENIISSDVTITYLIR
jgi:uncharacterized protein YggE